MKADRLARVNISQDTHSTLIAIANEYNVKRGVVYQAAMKLAARRPNELRDDIRGIVIEKAEALALRMKTNNYPVAQ